MKTTRRDRLVLSHLWLAEVLARRPPLSPGGLLDREDLVAAAYIGLIRAADRWQPRLGRFKSYASSMIYGTIRTAIRDASGNPRRNARPPHCSLDAVADPAANGRSDPAAIAEHRCELRVALHAFARVLTPNERRVIDRHYLQGRLLKHCLPGRHYSQASRLKKSALAKLREAMPSAG